MSVISRLSGTIRPIDSRLLYFVRELTTRDTLSTTGPNTATLKSTHDACKPARETYYKSHMQLFFIHYITSTVLFS
jgi:hypothetical protein